MESWHSYPSIFAIGHRVLRELLLDPVIVEEKVDGSQFSFGFDPELEIIRCRSKGCQLNIDAPEKMFIRAVEVVKTLPLHPGWTYRAEYLAKPKHNTLAYDRVPEKHLMVFDINTGHEDYMSYEQKVDECKRIGLEVVPLVYSGVIEDVVHFRSMIDRISALGGQKVEGVVIKNYKRFGPDKKVLMGKFVSEAFKEVHQGEWRASNPTQTDVLDVLIQTLRTPARWNKALQHLREAGLITDSPRDIGLLIKEAQADTIKECKDLIIEHLYNWALPKITRGIIGGLPEWYKDELLKKQFETEESSEDDNSRQSTCDKAEPQNRGEEPSDNSQDIQRDGVR